MVLHEWQISFKETINKTAAYECSNYMFQVFLKVLPFK